MSLLTVLLPVLVTLLSLALIVFVISLINKRLAKKVATIMGALFAVLVLVIVVVNLTQDTNTELDTSEKAIVVQAAERDFRDNFVRVDVPTKRTPPFTKAKYLVVVQSYESQDNVDHFISDACDKLEHKNTNIKVQPIQQSGSQPVLIDRTCDAL